MISKTVWEKCLICNKSLKKIKQEQGGQNVYFSKAFQNHLSIFHKINITDYFYNIVKLPKKYCPCGLCNKILKISRRSADFDYYKIACGRNNGLLRWSEEAKINRRGSGNPMYQKKPWNLNLTKYNHPSIMESAKKITGRKVGLETRNKQSVSAKKRLIHGHTGYHHTEETKEKSRQRTLQMIKEGKFKQTKTTPCKVFEQILTEIGITFESEYIISPYSFDYRVGSYLIEIDGDYFHSNPKIYPNGPKTKTQKINFYNDQRKNNFCKQNNLLLIRIWESDILNNSQDIICKLKPLLMLN